MTEDDWFKGFGTAVKLIWYLFVLWVLWPVYAIGTCDRFGWWCEMVAK